MFTRAILIASVGVAIGLAAPAYADSFNIGSFMIGNGGNSWVPQCKAPQVLTQLKDRDGRIHFVCAQPQAGNPQGEMKSASNAPR